MLSINVAKIARKCTKFETIVSKIGIFTRKNEFNILIFIKMRTTHCIFNSLTYIIETLTLLNVRYTTWFFNP